MTTPRIRFAVPSDHAGLLAMLLPMAQEAALLPVSVPKVHDWIAHSLAHEVVLLLHQGDEMMGTLSLVEDSPWYAAGRMLVDNWLYVRPEHRRTPHAANLIRAAVTYAEKRGLPLLMGFTSPTPGRMQAKSRLFSRVLGEPIGQAFYVPVKKAA